MWMVASAYSKANSNKPEPPKRGRTRSYSYETTGASETTEHFYITLTINNIKWAYQKRRELYHLCVREGERIAGT